MRRERVVREEIGLGRRGVGELGFCKMLREIGWV
jgi:hypothetical protein